MMPGISLDPCFIPFGADEEVYPASIFKMSRQVKEKAFIIFLLFLFLFGRPWGRSGGPPPPCVSLKQSTIIDVNCPHGYQCLPRQHLEQTASKRRLVPRADRGHPAQSVPTEQSRLICSDIPAFS